MSREQFSEFLITFFFLIIKENIKTPQQFYTDSMAASNY